MAKKPRKAVTVGVAAGSTAPVSRTEPPRTVVFDIQQDARQWEIEYLTLKANGFLWCSPDSSKAFGVSLTYSSLAGLTQRLIAACKQFGVEAGRLETILDHVCSPCTVREWDAAYATVSAVAWTSTGTMRPRDWRNKFCFDRWQAGNHHKADIWVATKQRPEWPQLKTWRAVHGCVKTWARKIGVGLSDIREGESGRPRKAK